MRDHARAPRWWISDISDKEAEVLGSRPSSMYDDDDNNNNVNNNACQICCIETSGGQFLPVAMTAKRAGSKLISSVFCVQRNLEVEVDIQYWEIVGTPPKHLKTQATPPIDSPPERFH